jgi:hypothetical protein
MNNTNPHDIFELRFAPGVDAITELPSILRELAETIEEGHPLVGNLKSADGQLLVTYAMRGPCMER